MLAFDHQYLDHVTLYIVIIIFFTNPKCFYIRNEQFL